MVFLRVERGESLGVEFAFSEVLSHIIRGKRPIEINEFLFALGVDWSPTTALDTVGLVRGLRVRHPTFDRLRLDVSNL